MLWSGTVESIAIGIRIELTKQWTIAPFAQIDIKI
jgi:hypothetical protein